MDCLTLAKANCHHCHKCIRYCPVKSIRFSENQAYIIGTECILCGQCYLTCPQDAAKIAVREAEAFLVTHDIEVLFCCFSGNDARIYEKLLQGVK